MHSWWRENIKDNALSTIPCLMSPSMSYDQYLSYFRTFLHSAEKDVSGELWYLCQVEPDFFHKI